MEAARDEARQRRFAGIDGLRAVAAAAVLVYHVWRFSAPDGERVDLGPVSELMPHLWHGVTLFFVLSGFLLYRPFALALLRGTPPPSIWRYLRGRALRIIPAYWVVLLVTVGVLEVALVADGSGGRSEGTPDAGLLAVNGLLVQNYSDETIFTGVGPAWSLAVELVFYAVLPLLALGALAVRAKGGGSRAAMLAPVAALLAVGFSGKLAAAAAGGWEPGIVRSFWGFADVLALGMLVAVVSVALEDRRLALPRRWRAAALAAIAAVVAAGAALNATNLHPADAGTLGFNVAAGAAAALLLSLVVLPGGTRPSRLVRCLDGRCLAGAGLISYSVFLWHEPLLRWLRFQGLSAGGPEGFVLNVAVVAIASGLLATVTYRCVELPALRLKAVRRGRAKAPAIARKQSQVGA